MILIHSNGIIRKEYAEWSSPCEEITFLEKYPKLKESNWNAIILAIFEENIYKYFEYMVARKEIVITPYEYGECYDSNFILIPFKKGKKQLFLHTRKEIYKKSSWLEDDEKLILEVM